MRVDYILVLFVKNHCVICADMWLYFFFNIILNSDIIRKNEDKVFNNGKHINSKIFKNTTDCK